MKPILGRILLLGLAVTALYLLVNPSNGTVYQGPMAVLGTALIGLGLCREAADRDKAACSEVRR